VGIRRLLRLDSGRSRVDGDIDDELRFHLEMRAADLAASRSTAREGQGKTDADAEAMALREFGDYAQYRDACRAIGKNWERQMKFTELLGSIADDIRFGLRNLRRAPSFAVVALRTLMLGIGATTSIFTVVNGVLLTPLPYDTPERIVHLGERPVGDAGRGVTTSYDNFADWAAQSRSFAAIGLYDGGTVTVMMGEPDRRPVSYVTAGVFDVFRLRPIMGRPIQPSDNVADAPIVAVITHAFWQQRMGGDPDVLGKTVKFTSISPQIVGVLPPFKGPRELDGEVWMNFINDTSDGRAGRSKEVVARLADRVSIDAARAEMKGIAERLAKQYPDDNEGMTATVTPIADLFVGGVRGMLVRLLGASALVLLIACANLSGLLIARGAVRRRELAIRTALGAGQRRVLRQMLTESVLLAGLGAALGLAFAVAGTKALVALGPASIAARPVTVDGQVLLFTIVLTVAAGIAFGIGPAWRARSLDLQAALRDGGRGNTDHGTRARSVLSAAQLALALLLLTTSGLLLKSFRRVLDVDPGVRTEQLLTFSMVMTSASYPEARAVPVGVDQYLARLGALPGVSGVTAASLLPLHGNWDRIAVDIAGMPVTQGANKPEGDRYVVSESYFRTMGVSLKRGRLFSTADTYDGMPVALVDEVFARRIFGDGDPIGRRMDVPGRDSMATIVGVVSHVKTYGMEMESPGQIYVSQRQYPWRWLQFAIHTTGDPRAVLPSVRALARSMDPRQPAYAIGTMDEHVGDLLRGRRFALALTIAFAAVALAMAAIGLYGLIAYSVTQRRREIGVRVALGATRSDITRLVLRQSMRLAGVGLLLGIAGSFAGGRLVAGMLFGVEPHDPWVLITVSLILVAAAALASISPARRATRVDPATALRAD
jgi:putative ABC transport system permease protein